MSYAGPAARGKRLPTIEVTQGPAQPSAGSEDATKARRPPIRRPEATPRPNRPTVAFTSGLALGVLIGAGVALLLAPQSGSETRRQLARRGRRMTARGRDAWDDLRYEFRRAARLRRRQPAPVTSDP